MDVLQLLIIRYNIDFVGGDIDWNSASATFGFGRSQKYRLWSVSSREWVSSRTLVQHYRPACCLCTGLWTLQMLACLFCAFLCYLQCYYSFEIHFSFSFCKFSLSHFYFYIYISIIFDIHFSCIYSSCVAIISASVLYSDNSQQYQKAAIHVSAGGVQEQAQDVLVPPLLWNCLTLNDTLFPVISPPPEQWSLQ